MKENRLTIAPEVDSLSELKLLPDSRAAKIKQTFVPMSEKLASFEDAYNALIEEASNGISEEITKKAKRLRLNIAKVRIATAKAKDEAKKFIKLEDRAIMGVHNILVWAVKEKEEELARIEKHFETLEKERLEKLQADRAAKLLPYCDDAHERRLSSMQEDEFEALFESKKRQHEEQLAAKAKAEADRKEREEREAKERARVMAENERLKREAKEKAEAEERERKARENRIRIQKEKYEAAIRLEQEEKRRIAAELKAKEDAEKREKEAIEAKRQAELAKGDAEKFHDFKKEINNLKIKYRFESAEYIGKYEAAIVMLNRIINEL